MTLRGRGRERLLAMVWGKSAVEAPGLHPLTLVAQEVYSRERKGTKAEAGHWFLKQPEAPAPPSPAEVGGTFTAWASLERSRDCSGQGPEDHPQNKIRPSRAPLWRSECGRRNCELVSNGPGSPPPSACGPQTLWAGGALQSCHGGLPWGVGLSVPGPVSVQGAAEARPAVGVASRAEVGLELHQGPCPAVRHLVGVQALGMQSSPRGVSLRPGHYAIRLHFVVWPKHAIEKY